MYSFHIQRHPFKTELEIKEFDSSVSLRSAYEQSSPILPIENARFTINDEIVTDMDRVPADNDLVCVKVVPGSEETTTGGIIGFFVGAGLIVLGMITAQPWLVGIGAGIAISGWAVGASSEWIMGTRFDSEEANPALYGSSNSSARWNPIPIIYGEHRLTPDMIAPDWTELDPPTSDDPITYLHQLYALGTQSVTNGTHTIVDRILLGDTRVFDYNSMVITGSIQRIEGSPVLGRINFISSSTPAYTNVTSFMSKFTTGGSISIQNCVRPSNNRKFTVQSYTADSITFVADNWIVAESGTVGIELRYLYDTGSYNGVTAKIIEDGDFSASPYPRVVYETSLRQELRKNVESAPFTTPEGTYEVRVAISTPYGLYGLDGSKKEQTSVSVSVKAKLVDGGSWLPTQTISINNQNTSRPRKKGVTMYLPSAGQWLLQFDKLTDDFDTEDGVNTVMVESVVCVKTDPLGDEIKPVNDVIKTEFSFLALRIQATDQLNGTINNLNCILRREVHAYDAIANRWVPAYSNNPAAIFLDVLTNPSLNKYPIATGNIWDAQDLIPVDWDTLNEWYLFCEDEGFTCDGVLSSATTVKNELEKIALTGRASFTIKDGKYTVNIDKPKTTVQMFTPRNTHSFSAKRSFFEIPDGVRIKFVDKDAGYQQNETNVYYDGSDLEQYDELSVEYITNTTNAKKYGRYWLNVKIARQEYFTFSTDFEYLVCTAGDRIKLQHDVPLFGMSAGRVSSVLEGGGQILGIVLDESVDMEAGQSYAIEIRLESGGYFTLETLSVVNAETTTNTLTFVTPQVLRKIRRGDLLAFGKTGLVTEDLVIADIACGEDLSAVITATKYDESIFSTEGFTYWDSYIGRPASASRGVYIPTAVDRSISDVVVSVDANRGNKIFNETQPVPPYRIGDVWRQGIQMYITTTTRKEGDAFESTDWQLVTSDTFQSVSSETFSIDHPEHRWYVTPASDYPMLEVHGFAVASEVGTNVKENVLDDDESYWESLANMGVLTVPEPIGADGYCLKYVQAKTANNQTSYVAGRWGLNSWHGEAFTNLIVSPDEPSTQDVVIAAGDYVLQTYSGSVSCTYGTATNGNPLSFTSTGETLSLTMTDAHYVSLTETDFTPPYVNGSFTANYNQYALTTPTVSGISIVHNQLPAYSNIVQLYLDANNYITLGVIGDVLRVIRKGAGIELIHDYELNEYIIGEELLFTIAYDPNTNEIDITLGSQVLDTLETWAYGYTSGSDTIVFGYESGGVTYVFGTGVVLDAAPNVLYVGVLHDLSAYANNQIHMIQY